LFIVSAYLLAIASAATTASGKFGYPTEATNSVGQWVNITYTVAAADISSANATILNLVFTPGTTTSATAVISYYWGFNGAELTNFLVKKALTDIEKEVDFIVSNPGGNATGMGAGTYTFGAMIESCTLCSEFTLTSSVQLYWGTQVQPFDAVQDPYTIDYSHAKDTFGQPSARVVLTATTNIYVRLDTFVGRGSEKIVFCYTQTIPTTTADYTAALKYPSGSPQEGDFSTGAISLTAGTWYISPYCFDNAGLPSINCQYDFAVGIGSEPAAAAFSAPSFLVVALLSIFAILAL
jgi:hypothetical protein